MLVQHKPRSRPAHDGNRADRRAAAEKPVNATWPIELGASTAGRPPAKKETKTPSDEIAAEAIRSTAPSI